MKRVPCQISEEFKNALLEIQAELLKQGKKISETELTKLIISTEHFQDVKKDILKKEVKELLKMDRRAW